MSTSPSLLRSPTSKKTAVIEVGRIDRSTSVPLPLLTRMLILWAKASETMMSVKSSPLTSAAAIEVRKWFWVLYALCHSDARHRSRKKNRLADLAQLTIENQRSCECIPVVSRFCLLIGTYLRTLLLLLSLVWFLS